MASSFVRLRNEAPFQPCTSLFGVLEARPRVYRIVDLPTPRKFPTHAVDACGLPEWQDARNEALAMGSTRSTQPPQPAERLRDHPTNEAPEILGSKLGDGAKTIEEWCCATLDVPKDKLSSFTRRLARPELRKTNADDVEQEPILCFRTRAGARINELLNSRGEESLPKRCAEIKAWFARLALLGDLDLSGDAEAKRPSHTAGLATSQHCARREKLRRRR
jgi:hypothetical protein